MVYGSETWPMTADELWRLERAERMMIRWMCGVMLKDRCKSEELRKRLDIEDVVDVVRKSRLGWSACENMAIVGNAERGRPKKRWNEVVEDDLNKCDTFGICLKEIA